MNYIKEKPRWMYRFDNFKNAFFLLREAVYKIKEKEIELSQLEKEGVIQRFEYTWELTWKVLKDYLEYTGVILETITPASTIKTAISVNMIKNGDIWMEALDSRNKMSHTYDFKKFEEIILQIQNHYYFEIEDLYLKMLKFETEYYKR
jgi:nucleotidyltransferase substrate binding protein (TIGR01987 family)